MDKGGVAAFLILTLGGSYAAYWLFTTAGGLTPGGVSLQHMAAFTAILFIPALAALIVSALRGDGAFAAVQLWPVPQGGAWLAILGFPLVFAALHAMGAGILGGGVDFAAAALMDALPTAEEAGLETLPPPGFFLSVGLFLSAVLGATLFAAMFVGQELGWRAYLLPQLMALGRSRAYALLGAAWAVWLAPLAILGFFGGEQHPALAVAGLVLAGLGLNAILNEIWLRSRHAGLTALWMGCFAGQAMGIWPYLFPDAELPWQGPFGLTGALCWAALAALLWKSAILDRLLPQAPAENPGAGEPAGG